MPETGEGVPLPISKEEIKLDAKVVEWLRKREGTASKIPFRQTTRPIKGGETVDSIKSAANKAIMAMGEMLWFNPYERQFSGVNGGVPQEMVKLGIGVKFGKVSVSARPEDDGEQIRRWTTQMQSIRRHDYALVPPVIAIKLGSREILHRGLSMTNFFNQELNQILGQSEGRQDAWAAVESLAGLSPRALARTFRKAIEQEQGVIRGQQKRAPKEELKVLRRGH